MRFVRLYCLGIFLGFGAAAFASLSEGGKVSPDGKEEITCDLPALYRLKNVGGRDGAGLCVFTALQYAGTWQGEQEMLTFQAKMRQENGGGWPEKVDEMMKKYAPHVRYVQHTDGDPAVLTAILKSGRMACITYAGRDMHYGQNKKVAHMVDCVHFTELWAAVADNNFTRDDQFVWMTPADLVSRWKDMSGGWAICLLSPPPPPIPHN